MFTFFNKRLYLSLLLGEPVDFPDSRRRSMARDIPKCRSNSEKAVRAMTLQIAYALLFLFILCPVSECQGPLLVREGIPLGAVLNLAYILVCLYGISAAVAFRTSWLILYLMSDIALNVSVLTLMVYDYKEHGTSEILVRYIFRVLVDVILAQFVFPVVTMFMRAGALWPVKSVIAVEDLHELREHGAVNMDMAPQSIIDVESAVSTRVAVSPFHSNSILSENAAIVLGGPSSQGPPSDLVCPITQETYSQPVIAADGHTYEHSAMLTWLETHDTSPMTGEALAHKSLTPNHRMTAIVASWQEGLEREARQSREASKLLSPENVLFQDAGDEMHDGLTVTDVKKLEDIDGAY